MGLWKLALSLAQGESNRLQLRLKALISIGLMISLFCDSQSNAGTSHLTLDTEFGLGWLSQGVFVEGAFERSDSREKNLFLRPEEKERLRKRRKGISPIRWWTGYRLSRPAYVGIGDAGVTEEWSHRFQGGMGARLLSSLELGFDLALEDTPTDALTFGGIEIFPTWIPAKGWRVELRGGLFGLQKAAGATFELSDGSVNTSVASSVRRTQWGLVVRGDLSRSVTAYLGGSASLFAGDPDGFIRTLNGFLELDPAQVYSSSGLSPIRRLYDVFPEYRVEAGVRFGRIEVRPWEAEETDPWYLELRGDFTMPIVFEFPVMGRVMPAAGFKLGERWQLRIEPEFWVGEAGFDWLANLGLRVNL